MSSHLRGTVSDTDTTYGVVREDDGTIRLVPLDGDTPPQGQPGQDPGQTGQTQADNSQQPQGGGGTGGSESESDSPPDKLDPLAINPAFKARLNSVMSDNRYDRRLNHRTRGKLDMTGLHRVGAGATNVFSQKQARKGKNYNIVLLVDVSGSMSGWSRSFKGGELEAARVYAAKHNISVEEAMRTTTVPFNIDIAANVSGFLAVHFKGMNIEYEVIAFDDQPHTVKTFDKDIKPEVIQSEIVRMSGGGTQMLPALEHAYKSLRYKSGQSFVIVISDGQTGEGAEIKKVLHANPDVKAFGIGIGGSTCEVIPDNQTIQDTNELQTVILQWLSKHVRRGV